MKTILTCFACGIALMAVGQTPIQMIGATIAFFGCYQMCLKMQIRRINREIDRYEAMVGRPAVRYPEAPSRLAAFQVARVRWLGIVRRRNLSSFWPGLRFVLTPGTLKAKLR